ncbi:MAG: hypothetical protein ACYDBO_11055 [Vulcanimicrobiaceae bacterium]
MALRARTSRAAAYDRGLERRVPIKITLVRANPYTCTCAEEGRSSPAMACATCNGTGYTGGARGANLQTASAPYNTIYYIYGDIQPGHGLYGQGGDFVFIDTDLGKLEAGDGFLFTKLQEYDRASGKSVYPSVDAALVRPDRVIAGDGTVYTVLKDLRGNLGGDNVFRMYLLRQGDQGVK